MDLLQRRRPIEGQDRNPDARVMQAGNQMVFRDGFKKKIIGSIGCVSSRRCSAGGKVTEVGLPRNAATFTQSAGGK